LYSSLSISYYTLHIPKTTTFEVNSSLYWKTKECNSLCKHSLHFCLQSDDIYLYMESIIHSYLYSSRYRSRV